jgi:NhaA family Na+:H+ antiporter
MGVLCGLILGKPLGISLFSWISLKLKIASLPNRTTFSYIIGAGILGGIGFTMSIFISMLAFEEVDSQNLSKLAVLIASFMAALIGLLYLHLNTKKKATL